MKIRRFIAVFLSALILCGVLTVPAAALEDPAIRAKAALLVEAETGTILYDKNIHDELSIASTTKIMSALLVFEAIDRGELRLDQQVTATATALRGLPEDGSTADIVEGETLTVEQLLYCMLVISANETCNILGETLCGSVDAFVARMNQRAQELGCKNTHFANTTGLTQSGHYSSAYDLYLITREAIKHEDFMTMVNTKSYEIPPTNKTEEERVLHSTNALISNWRLAGYLYSGAQGIKTGSTDAAGQCLVSSAVRGSRTLISVVLGAEKVEKENGSGYIVESFTETARLFDWGFDNFAPQQVLDENELIQEVPVALSKQVSTVAVHPAESADAMLPKDLDVSALTRTVTLDNETLATDKKGCRRFGPCGVGEKALYLNDLLIDRHFYVGFGSVRRVFKRVAMSQGGFSGKGAFGSIPYLVVQYDDGQEKQCTFKREEDVDELLAYLGQVHPEIPRLSVGGEQRLAKKAQQEASRYLKELTPQAQSAREELERARKFLSGYPELTAQLAAAAKAKRINEHTNPAYRWVALAIVLAGAAALVYGIISWRGGSDFGVYFALFGFAAVFFFSGAHVLPTAKNNRRAVERAWDEAQAAMANVLPEDFPLPARYAHPIVLDRMIRILREGRAQSKGKALDVLKADLRALTADVQVEQEEHDEVVVIKPLFLVSDYQ